MKWLIGLLLALAVAWLVIPRGGGSGREGEVVESSRQVLDAAWRGKPESEMTIGEMERYAAGLGDEELWEEMEKVYGDWMDENEGREHFRQPRLAVMLAREIGKREGEVGMMEVARWLEGLEPSFDATEEDVLKMQRQFFNMRALTSAFGGWVADEPDEAISRLIQSGGNEEEWPVPNQGILMYIKFDDFFAMERVLRDGFARLAKRDLERAQELLVEGTAVWSFDVNEIFESVFQFMSEEEKVSFFDAKLPREIFFNLEEVEDTLLNLEENSYRSVFEDLVHTELWTGDDFKVWTGDVVNFIWLDHALDLLVRVQPDEAAQVLSDSRTSEDEASRLFAFLAASNPSKYELLSEIPENSKRRALDLLLEGERVMNFGPIDGKEDSWEIDYEKLKFAVSDLEIDSDEKSRLLDDIHHHREIR